VTDRLSNDLQPAVMPAAQATKKIYAAAMPDFIPYQFDMI
jgi:hypothetical protein